MPPSSLLTQDSRFLLSPVPASMAAAQGQSIMNTTVSAPTSTATAASKKTITLYPIEAVPSHLLCAICTLPYDNPVHFLPCCHVFCLECIQLWIGMNLGDDQLQNELRRAYPAQDELDPALVEAIDSGSGNSISQAPFYLQQQQQFMIELARMGDSRSTPGSAQSLNNFYDSFHHLSPAQQHLMRQQQVQQRIAVLLESREMPKCPMCRTALHIQSWDRIEQQIQVPVTISHRPRPTGSTTSLASNSSASEWTEQGGHMQGQRPVSGVERRRTRPDRFAQNGSMRRGGPGQHRGEVINEEEEDQDEEIEMEQVGALRGGRNSSSSGNAASPFPSASASSSMFVTRHSSRPERAQQQYPESHFLFSGGNLFRRGSVEGNEDEDIASPATAVIGRRPSEWMRHQQRQMQAHQERRFAAGTAATDGPSQSNPLAVLNEATHSHDQMTTRHDAQQEQIRRLYLEQESQEELLRTLTARAAAIIEAGEEFRRGESGSVSPSFSGAEDPDVSRPMHPLAASTTPTTRAEVGSSDSSDDQQEQRDSRSSEDEDMTQRTQPRHSLLQIDTSLPRASSNRQNAASRNRQSHSRQASRDVDNPRSEQATSTPPAERIEEDLSQRQAPAVDAIAEDESTQSASSSGSDSLSDSTRSYSETQSSNLPTSPSNASTFSYRTSSTFSHSALNQTSTTGTPFSQRSPRHHTWDRQSLSLQMPVLEADAGCMDGNERQHEDYVEQPWHAHDGAGDQHAKDQEQTSIGEFSGSSLDIELRRTDGKTSTETLDGSSDSTAPVGENTMPISQSSDSMQDAANQQQSAESQGLATSTLDMVDPEQSDQSPQDTTSAVVSSAHLLASTDINGPSGPSSISPLVQDLDIHCPITTAEGSVTTIADMQMHADILARARATSALHSDEDEPNTRDYSSPIDSPIPTPSTARPRRRFPAGISLAGDEDLNEDEDESQLADIDDSIHEDTSEEAAEAVNEPATALDQAIVSDHGSPIISDVTQGNNDSREELASTETMVLNEQAAAAAIDIDHTRSPAIPELVPNHDSPIMPIQDPLSVTVSSTGQFSGVQDNAVESEDERPTNHSMVPLVQPLGATLSSSSPPPLPLPLPSPVDINNSALVSPLERTDNARERGMDNHAPSMRTLDERVTDDEQDEEVSEPYPENTLPQLGEQDDDAATTRTEEIIQYRTLVRYQPRLPKAHIMSDLISQIRVECPQREFGCQETTEMQQALQHGRDLCQYRLVMCPRARCGLWMRADQILEHILMVEPGSLSSSSSAPGSPRSSAGPCSSSSSTTSSHSPGRIASSGSSQRLGGNTGARNPSRSLRTQQSRSASASKGPHQVSAQKPSWSVDSDANSSSACAPSSSSSSSSSSSTSWVPPCPGLTWEREQLAKATGIIGQLTEENTSLRQMIRQLTVQNSKLLKDKDRWQRYANLGLGRD
ncbi:hypothetical protein BG011_007208 [Mortierella polycephala]|uniref:RING-type domain-containing protein n=1 Tax=Mortierella polycephala TaxID=41804 RepID=A0A9P6TYJ0_9FUNG|nr:hypothetical protein BG011_007208 [Mortierella polycephala]